MTSPPRRSGDEYAPRCYACDRKLIINGRQGFIVGVGGDIGRLPTARSGRTFGLRGNYLGLPIPYFCTVRCAVNFASSMVERGCRMSKTCDGGYRTYTSQPMTDEQSNSQSKEGNTQ